MSIITPFDFKGENQIGQVEIVSGVQENVQYFIDKYEPKFLKALLGKVLAAEFKAGLAADPIDPKWISLRDETDIKEMLICYVYYWYQRYNTTYTAGTSEVKAKTENARPVSSVDKQVRSWNEMVKMARLFDLSTDQYPSYVRPYWNHHHFAIWGFGCREVNEIYLPINSLGI